MSFQIIPKTQQARGQFNGGEILENKPIGFPREGGALRPYSNLFYWAHAWSDKGSTIGLHPHQGFEIMSFVLEGDIEHYDTGDNEWRKLKKGDAQIIRAGNGISHSERINEEAHIFQIWFDPDLSVTLEKEASYDDYASDSFPVAEDNGLRIKTYKGDGSPLQMDTPGIGIFEWEASEGTHQIKLAAEKTYSLYLIQGEVDFKGNPIQQDDFFILEGETALKLEAKEDSKLFVIESPQKLEYTTYGTRTRF